MSLRSIQGRLDSKQYATSLQAARKNMLFRTQTTKYTLTSSNCRLENDIRGK